MFKNKIKLLFFTRSVQIIVLFSWTFIYWLKKSIFFM